MVDEKKPFDEGEEEEYQFSEEDIDKELSEFDASSSHDDMPEEEEEQKSRFSALLGKLPFKGLDFSTFERRHYVIFAIVVFIVLFGLVKCFSGGAKKSTISTKQTTTQNAAFKPLGEMKQSSSTKSSSQITAMPVTKAETTKAVTVAPSEDKLDQIVSQQKEHAEKLADLEEASLNRINRLEQDNRSLQNQVQSLSGQIQSLQSTISSLNSQLSTVAKHMTTEQSHKTHKSTVHRAAPHTTHYFVEAVIPGRAWLQSDAGQTVSVAVGDNLDGYGTITAIDPYTGDVTTSSGKVLHYGTGVEQ